MTSGYFTYGLLLAFGVVFSLMEGIAGTEKVMGWIALSAFQALFAIGMFMLAASGAIVSELRKDRR